MLTPEGTELHNQPENSNEALPGLSDSGLAVLLDLRVIVFLICVGVVAMTATVWMNTADQPKGDSFSGSGSAAEPTLSNPTDEVKKPGKTNGTTSEGKPGIEPASSGEFDLTFRQAVLSGCEIQSNSGGIGKWSAGGVAQWSLATPGRQNGFYDCRISYRAQSKAQFLVQVGGQPPKKFTVYPRDDFTEQFIVRFQKSDEQSFRLAAEKVDSLAGVQVTRIQLIARK